MSLVSSFFLLSLSLWCFFGVFLGFVFSNLNLKGVWGFSNGKTASFFLKVSSVFRLFVLILYLFRGPVRLRLDWLLYSGFCGFINIIFDRFSLFFFVVAFLVSWSILEFSIFYMDDDPFAPKFFRLLLLFLLNMLVLTCSKSFFLLFIG